jgi:hypothetical protein
LKTSGGRNPTRSIAATEHFQMMTKRDFVRSTALTAIAFSVSKSGRARAQTAVDSGSARIRDIAAEGFIYGLSIVMNFGAMYAFAVDRNSGQFKAPFNEIANAHSVFTYKGYRRRDAEQRHALFERVDGPEGGANRALGSGCRSQALLFSPAMRRRHVQLWLHRLAHDRRRRRRLHGGRAEPERTRSGDDQARVPLEH